MRGSIAGHGLDGEWERSDGTEPFNDSDGVLAVFLAAGGAIEAYVPPSDTADDITGAPDTLFGGPTLKESFDGY